MPSHFGVVVQEQSEDQLLHRIASIWTSLIKNIFTKVFDAF